MMVASIEDGLSAKKEPITGISLIMILLASNGEI
jgi:hypothetical protein